MKKLTFCAAILAFAIASVMVVNAAAGSCSTIKSGGLKDSAGNYLQTGYDQWGYNYQAMMFNGKYCDAYRNASWCQAYKEDELIMKWNAGWLSNQDCDGDGLLDRHYGFASYIGSGAWLTNHQKGTYVDDDGKTQRWEYFVKIVAAPADAVVVNGKWQGSDGIVIGPVIWGEFATIQEVYNDTGTGEHGLLYKSPTRPGLGAYKP